jgi:hypothetical protein
LFPIPLLASLYFSSLLFALYRQKLIMANTAVDEKRMVEAKDDFDLEKQQHETASSEKGHGSDESVNQTQDAPKPPVNPWADPSSFPDGGAPAWLTVAAASACFFVSWGWINCIGVFQEYFMRGTHSPRVTMQS